MNYGDFLLKFSTENAAFERYPLHESARILRTIADKLEQGEELGRIRDLNGSTIGEWVIAREM